MIKKIGLIFILSCLILTACANTTVTATTTPTASTSNPAAGELPTLPTGALFQVIKQDGSSVAFTLDDLKEFPLAVVSAEGKFEEGPALTDVLAAAGVTDYTSIHLDGSSSPADLTREEVEAGAILDFNNHGTVKLASLAIEKASWTKDVSLIEVH